MGVQFFYNHKVTKARPNGFHPGGHNGTQKVPAVGCSAVFRHFAVVAFSNSKQLSPEACNLKLAASPFSLPLPKPFIVIAIENVIVSDDVVEAKFVCDLHKCKGGCCEDGDAGAPLEKDEKKQIDKYFDTIKPYLTPEGLSEIKSQGKYLYDREFGWVTPTINGKICAYGHRDKQGIIKCGIEQAYNDGKIEWKKPISCHLYPIRVAKSREYIRVNYEPRETLCQPGCALGKKLKLPVYEFLKEALIRKFGTEFYETLHQVAIEHYDEVKKK